MTKGDMSVIIGHHSSELYLTLKKENVATSSTRFHKNFHLFPTGDGANLAAFN